MKFSATILTDQTDDRGETMDLAGVTAPDEIPLTFRFSSFRDDYIGTSHITEKHPTNIRIDGDVEGTFPAKLYAAPGGYIDATEMRDGVQVITRFRICEISLTDPHVPPIEVSDG